MNRLRVYRQPISLMDKLANLTDLALSDISNSMLLKEQNAWHMESPVLGFRNPIGDLELFGLFLFGTSSTASNSVLSSAVYFSSISSSLYSPGAFRAIISSGLADIRRLVLELDGAVLGAFVQIAHSEALICAGHTALGDKSILRTLINLT